MNPNEIQYPNKDKIKTSALSTIKRLKKNKQILYKRKEEDHQLKM